MNDCERRLWQMLRSRDESLQQLKKDYVTLDESLSEQREATARVVLEFEAAQAQSAVQRQELRLKILRLQQEEKGQNRGGHSRFERQCLKYADLCLDQMRKASPLFWIFRPKAWMFRSLKHHLRKQREETQISLPGGEQEGTA